MTPKEMADHFVRESLTADEMAEVIEQEMRWLLDVAAAAKRYYDCATQKNQCDLFDALEKLQSKRDE